MSREDHRGAAVMNLGSQVRLLHVRGPRKQDHQDMYFACAHRLHLTVPGCIDRADFRVTVRSKVILTPREKQLDLTQKVTGFLFWANGLDSWSLEKRQLKKLQEALTGPGLQLTGKALKVHL
ncbi:hypothetical protein NDU88_003538 [Pleurodeles waltl]|uniref:Uncharacterized protein n=1 Tax=Pleurodeles waltl TaxID=8319 RepID=A0AAV7KXR2_PLEWA|nr:hypothetical protein NDU88_003538 [Pleurodeles waltl]